MKYIFLSFILSFVICTSSFAASNNFNNKTIKQIEISPHVKTVDFTGILDNFLKEPTLYAYLGPCPDGYRGYVMLWIVYDENDNILASGGDGGCEKIPGQVT